MVIRGRGKFGYINGSKVKPVETNPDFQVWDAENSLVMAWLVNSMEPEIGQTFLLYSTVKELWDSAKATFSDFENSAYMCELRDKTRNLKQGDQDVTSYFHSLTKLWQELDLYNQEEWSCAADALRYKKIVERERIYDFLNGLNKELDEVRGRVLGVKPLPDIKDIFSEDRREESRKMMMLGSDGSMLQNVENSAMVVQNQEKSSDPRVERKFWCDHCNKSNHNRDKCWKLHGKSQNWKGKNSRKENRAL